MSRIPRPHNKLENSQTQHPRFGIDEAVQIPVNMDDAASCKDRGVGKVKSPFFKRSGYRNLTAPTSKKMPHVLKKIMRQINKSQAMRPDLILAAWNELANKRGMRFAAHTKAHSFEDGILTVKVKNSTLLSLLKQHEKPRLIKELREKFPSAAIQNIYFCIG